MRRRIRGREACSIADNSPAEGDLRHRANLPKLSLDELAKIQTVSPPSHAPIVYRLGRVVLIHQSGVRLSVGAPV